jgi:6-hydroxymethylpterin diphosphokinase MptE-like
MSETHKNQLKTEIEKVSTEKEKQKHLSEIERLKNEVKIRQNRIDELLNSLSWKITAPLRALSNPGHLMESILGVVAGIGAILLKKMGVIPKPVTAKVTRDSIKGFSVPQKKSEELLVYLDPGFFSDWGHYTSFGQCIHDEAVKRGLDLWHFSTPDVTIDSIKRFRLIPFFEYRAILPPDAGFIRSDVGAIFTFLGALQGKVFDKATRKTLCSFQEKIEYILDTLLTLPQSYRKITFYMYTGHPLYIGLFAEILGNAKYANLNLVVNLGLFYLNLDFCRAVKITAYETLLNQVSTALERNDLKGRIRIFSDSERSIDLYGPFFQHAIRLAPIPLTNKLPQTLGRKKSSNEITIGFFGFAHEIQGFPLCIKLYDRLVKDPEFSHVNFIVRHNTKHSTRSMKALSGRFQERSERIVHLKGNFLPDEEYERYVSLSDIIVIPHSTEHYPCQTSGIFTVSLLNRKIVVVADDTWMADQLRFFGSGLTFSDNYSESFIAAVTELLRNYGAFQSNVEKNMNLFEAFHSTTSLFHLMNIGRSTEDKLTKTLIAQYLEINQELSGQHRLAVKEKQLLASLPWRAPIYLPTNKIPLAERVKGMEKVVDIDRNRWKSVYHSQVLQLREQYKGLQRCFVIGNGPSLNDTDLGKLQNEVSFGVNGIFLKFAETNFRPTFYVVEDHLVAEDRADAINALRGVTKLFPIYLAYCLDEGQDTIFFNHRPRKSYPHGFDFSTDASKITYTGCTVTFTCLQLAYCLGVKEIYLIGVDHSYAVPDSTKIEKSYNVEIYDMDEDDPNHFDPSYFGKGFRWHNPQSDKMEEAYREAKLVTDAGGCKIFNATRGGKLEVFPRVNYESLF